VSYVVFQKNEKIILRTGYKCTIYGKNAAGEKKEKKLSQ
jgi:hypothetical protein